MGQIGPMRQIGQIRLIGRIGQIEQIGKMERAIVSPDKKQYTDLRLEDSDLPTASKERERLPQSPSARGIIYDFIFFRSGIELFTI